MSEYVWPCPLSARITSGFGPRAAPVRGASTNHKGIDIAAPHGAPIVAAKSGEVTVAAYLKGYGNAVYLRHPGGAETRYAHASRLLVKAGQAVQAGAPIAEVGSTGNSSGNHLHFEIRVGGTPVNPTRYVQFKDSPPKVQKDENKRETSPYSKPKNPLVERVAEITGQSAPAAPAQREIAGVTVQSTLGALVKRENGLSNRPPYLQNGVEILIQNDKIYLPAVEDGVTLESARRGAPAKLTFTVCKDAILNFQEGSPVTLRFGGQGLFAGYVFTKSRSDSRSITVTAYDQMRYLKNKETRYRGAMTYTALLREIARDYGLLCGETADTGFVLPEKLEEGTLMDILANASDETTLHTGKTFVLYDDFGKLTLKSLAGMRLDVLIDEARAEKYTYTSGIDQDVYNRVVLAADDEETGTRMLTVANDGERQALWGILQYYEKQESGAPPALLQEKAKALLAYYSRKRRTLQVDGAFGDIRVRGGSLVVVKLGLGDINVQNYMVAEKVRHTFRGGLHTMDLHLSGAGGEKGAFV